MVLDQESLQAPMLLVHHLVVLEEQRVKANTLTILERAPTSRSDHEPR